MSRHLRLNAGRGVRAAAALLCLAVVPALAADAARDAPKVTPLAVNPVVLPTPDVPSTPLTAAPGTPAPKAAAKSARSGKASTAKARAPGRSKPAHPPAKKRARRK